MMVRELYATLKFENRKMNARKWFVCSETGARVAGPFDSKEEADARMADMVAPAKPAKKAAKKAEPEPEPEAEVAAEVDVDVELEAED